MSGVLVIPNQFAAAVTATAGAIDVNFNSVTAYINDPTNRNNYATDIGNTNTVALSFVPAVVGGYTTGLDITWKWAATNTGAVVVNANTIGNASLVNPDGSALLPGQGLVGSIGHAVYDGTRYINLAGPIPATKAMMQTATVTSGAYVTPSQMQNSPGVAKAHAQWTGTSTGTITPNSAYNISSIVRTGTGTYSISFATSFANTAYPVVVGSSGAASFGGPIDGTRLTSGVVIRYLSNALAPVDIADLSFVAYGTQ